MDINDLIHPQDEAPAVRGSPKTPVAGDDKTITSRVLNPSNSPPPTLPSRKTEHALVYSPIEASVKQTPRVDNLPATPPASAFVAVNNPTTLTMEVTPTAHPSVATANIIQSRKASKSAKNKVTKGRVRKAQPSHGSTGRPLTEKNLREEDLEFETSSLEQEIDLGTPIRRQLNKKAKKFEPESESDDELSELEDDDDDDDDEEEEELELSEDKIKDEHDHDHSDHVPNNRQAKRKAARTTAKAQPKAGADTPEMCMKDGCNQSDGKNFRTGVLDAFGRNKRGTKTIKRFVRWCRKCYQQASYHRYSWPVVKCVLIKGTLNFIQYDDPGTTFTVTLRKQEMVRLNRARSMGIDRYIEEAEAGRIDDNRAASYTAQPESNRDGEVISINAKEHSRCKRQSQSFKKATIPVLDDFMNEFGGEHKDQAHCLRAMEWTKKKFLDGEIDDLIRFEFIPEIERPAEPNQTTPRTASTTKTPKKGIKRSSTEIEADGDVDVAKTPAKKRVKAEPRTPRTPKTTSK